MRTPTIHADIVTHACTYTHINAGTHICIQTCRHTSYTHMHTHICTHTIHVDIVTNARTYIHINASHTYARVRARTHTHTHTHTHCCTTRGFSVPPTVKGCVEVAQKIPTVSVIVSS